MRWLWRRYARGVPEYLARYYWWAYLAEPAVWFFDHQAIINAILFGQYQALMDETMRRYSARPAGCTLQLTAVYGKLTPTLAGAAGDSEFHLMDVATVQLELARRKLRAANQTVPQAEHLARMNAESLAYASDSFDTIVLFFLLHEMPPAARRRTLTECSRVLRPGGRLLITEYGTLTKSHLLHRFAPFRAILGKLEPFLPGFWQENLSALLSRCASSCEKRIILIEENPIFGAFYRVAEFEARSAAAGTGRAS